MPDWAFFKSTLPVGDGDEERRRRTKLWRQFGTCHTWLDHGKDLGIQTSQVDSEEHKEFLELDEVVRGITVVFQCRELWEARPAITKAYDYARSMWDDGDDEKLEFCEFRLLLIYLSGLCDVYLLFKEIDVNHDGVLEREEIRKGRALLEEQGIEIEDPDELWELLRGDDEYVDFDEFVHWACEAGLAGKELHDREMMQAEMGHPHDVESLNIAPESSFARCLGLKPENKDFHKEHPPKNVLTELLQHNDVDLNLLNKLVCRTLGVEVNYVEPAFGWTPLLFGARRGSARILQQLLEAKADPDIRCFHGNSALHIAAREGFDEAVDYLLSQHLPADLQNEDGVTPLMFCAMNGCPEVLNTLTFVQADVTTVDKDGRTASQWAAKHGHVGVMRSLLAKGFDMAWQDKGGQTVMDLAQGQLEMRTVLLNAERLNHELISAAGNDDAEAVGRALEQGAYVDTRDDLGWTAMTWAFMNRSVDMVKILANYNADPDFLNSSEAVIDKLDLGNERRELERTLVRAHGTTARLVGAAREASWHIVTSELNEGARINSRERVTLLTCFMFAAMHCAPSVLRLLAERRADTELRDVVGWTAVHFGVQSGDPETISSLIYVRADIGAATWDLNTPMHIVARANNGSLIQLLSTSNCPLSSVNADGHVPLQVAARWGCVESVITLVCYNADVRVMDASKRSVLTLAVLGGSLPVFEALMGMLPKETPEICEAELLFHETVGVKKQRLKQEARQKRREERREVKRRERDEQRALEEEEKRLAQEAEGYVAGNESAPLAADPKAKMPEPAPATHDEKLAPKAKRGSRPKSGTRPKAGTKAKSEPRPKSAGRPKSEAKAKAKAEAAKAEEEAEETDEDSIVVTDSESEEEEYIEEDWIDQLDDPCGPLRAAHKRREELCIQLKLERVPVPVGGVSLFSMPDCDGRQALAHAAMSRNALMVPVLIESKANCNAMDEQGDTPLHIAAMEGVPSIVADMLGAFEPADTFKRNKSGRTPADLASNELVKEMINRAAVKTKIKPTKKNSKEAVKGKKTSAGRCFRCRLEGLPPHVLPEFIEEDVRAMCRKLSVVPSSIFIATDLFSQRPLGYAYVDFGKEAEAERVASWKSFKIKGRMVTMIRDEVCGVAD